VWCCRGCLEGGGSEEGGDGFLLQGAGVSGKVCRAFYNLLLGSAMLLLSGIVCVSLLMCGFASGVSPPHRTLEETVIVELDVAGFTTGRVVRTALNPTLFNGGEVSYTWTCPPQHERHCPPGESRRHEAG